MIEVTMTPQGGAPEVRRFDKDEILVGRTPPADLVIGQANVSRRHFRIRVEDGACLISDDRSTGGTYVNGARVSLEQPIAPTDVVKLGDLELRFSYVEDEEEGVPIASAAAATKQKREQRILRLAGRIADRLATSAEKSEDPLTRALTTD